MHRCLSISEILLSIAEIFDNSGDLSRFTRCCRSFRTVASPLLLRDIDIPLDSVEDVLAFSATFPFGRFTDLRISSSMAATNDDSVSGRTRKIRAWSHEAAKVLQAISTHGSLRNFAWGMVVTLLDIPSSICNGLVAASMTLENLCLRCRFHLTEYEVIESSIFASSNFPTLRSLDVHVGVGPQFNMAWLNSIVDGAPRLETLILISSSLRNFELSSCRAGLRNFQIRMSRATDVPGLEDFFRHQTMLERVGLSRVANAIEPGTLPELMGLMFEPTNHLSAYEFAHSYKSLRHVRFREPPYDHFARHTFDMAKLSVPLACLEIDWTRSFSFQSNSLLLLPILFPNIRELGVLTAAGPQDEKSTYLPSLLFAASRFRKLVALRIMDQSYRLPDMDRRGLRDYPPRLRYIAWDGNDGRTYYTLRPLGNTMSVIDIDPPALRTPRSDWTGESLFDHLAADPGY